MKINYTFEKKQMLCTFWAVLASLLLPLGAWAETQPSTDSEGYYLISNADELIWFSNKVNSGSTTIKGKLTADIDLDGKNYTSIGNTESTAYAGKFNGQFHRIKNMILEGNYRGFIGHVGDGFSIEGVIIDKTCRVISTTNQVGGVVGYCPGATYRISIKNCGNEAPVSGVYHVGGIFGGIRGNVNVSYDNVTISNCYNTGTITTTERNGYAIAGYVGSGKAIIENCWNSGTIETSKTKYFSRYDNGLTFTNNYGLADTPRTVAKGNDEKRTNTEATSFTKEELANGALTSMLNEGKTDGTQVWYQKIGVDTIPVFGKTDENIVYCIGDFACDGKTAKGCHYSNDAEDQPVVAKHKEAEVWDNAHYNYDITCQNCKEVLGKCFHYDDSENTVTVTKNKEGDWHVDSEITLSDSYGYKSPVAFIAKGVTYTRTMSDNYGSLILPFEAMSDENVTLYSLAEVNDDNVTFQKAETIEAGTPCIFHVREGKTEAVITGENVTLVEMNDAPVNGVAEGDMQMHGTYQKLTGQTNLWFLAKDALYYSSTAPVTLLPFRSWLTGSAPSPAAASNMRNIFIEEEGMTTAIECINNQVESASSYTYDLQGRLVKNQKSGFMIQNGKKVLVGSK